MVEGRSSSVFLQAENIPSARMAAAIILTILLVFIFFAH